MQKCEKICTILASNDSNAYNMGKEKKEVKKMNAMVIFDVVITLFGFYMILSSFQMKKTGVISSTVVSKQEIMNCKNPTEFIAFMFWKEAVFGAVIMVVGALSLIDELVVSLGPVNFAEMIIFLVAFIWFTRELRKAREQFF